MTANRNRRLEVAQRSPNRIRSRWSMCRAGLLAALLGGLPMTPAWAHAPSNAYLSLQTDGSPVVEQRLDIALRDLDRELRLDSDDDGRITWGELQRAWPDIDAYSRDGLALRANRSDATPCEAGALAPPQIETHSDGTHAVLRRRWTCGEPVRQLALRYTLFADSDPTHRGIARLQGAAVAGGEQADLASAVLKPGPALQWLGTPGTVGGVGAGTGTGTGAELGSNAAAGAGADHPADVAAPPSGWAGFVGEGIHHILIGTDHLLFLLALLLPAVLIRQRPGAPSGTPSGTPVWRGLPTVVPVGLGLARVTTARAAWVERTGWTARPAVRPVVLDVARLVTAFTVAHSITLALAVTGLVHPPTRWIESLIAFSVALAALDNLWPVLPRVRWKLAFVFGLVHGFGFGSALLDLGLQRASLASALFGFNLGVEIGQLGLVALFLPLAWWLRDSGFYRQAVLKGGSLLIGLIAVGWCLERALDLKIY